MEATPKRLSCDRCHSQKLRCPRQSSDGAKGCSRCLRRGVECVYSMPLPKGRPRTNRSSPTNVGAIEPAWPSSEPPNLAPNHASSSISASRSGPGPSAKNDALQAPLPRAHPDFLSGVLNETDNMTQGTMTPSAFSQSEWNDALADWPSNLPQNFQQSIPTPMTTHHNLASSTLQQSAMISMEIPERNVFDLQQPLANRVDRLRYDSSGEDEMDLVHTGYTGPENSSKPRFVENAFWALVHGQVSALRQGLTSLSQLTDARSRRVTNS